MCCSTSALNWLFDATCLVLAFAVVGLAIPWRNVLFAYAAAQVAGSFSFLPGGLGAVEGGMVGGFLLAGTPGGPALAATLVYRVISYWAVTGAGVILLIILTRRDGLSTTQTSST